jgi:D-alanyl-D-alanine carboxypeptidase (penicillin-binding protein 5/6)
MFKIQGMLNKILYTLLGASTVLLIFSFTKSNFAKTPVVSGSSTINEANLSAPKTTPEIASNTLPPDLTSNSAMAYDLNSGTVLYSKNLNDKLPIASLTKLMTAIVVMENESNLDAVVTVKNSDVAGVVGSTIGLVPGEKITVRDLLFALLIPSSNDAALTLADFVGNSQSNFVKLMNDKSQQLGLVGTHFANPIGWDIGDNYSNTSDLIKIVKEFLKYPMLQQIVKTKQTTIYSIDQKYSHELDTTNKLLLTDPRVIGLKTGFTSKALGNLIIEAADNRNFVLVVVLDSQNREDDAQKLLDWVFQVYRW